MLTKKVIILLFATLLTACESQVLFSELTEAEANEIVAVLYSENLTAEKVSEKKSGTYKVFTDKSSFSGAVSVLQSRGLPRERFESVGDVFEKEGFVSSPLEERARLNYAVSQELSRTLSNIDGVIMARVHLAVPKRAHLADTASPSSASVFVKHRADVDLARSVGKIKSLVVTGMENLPYENVTVGLFPAEHQVTSNDKPVVPVVMKASLAGGSVSSVLLAAMVVFGSLLLIGMGTILRPALLRMRSGRK